MVVLGGNYAVGSAPGTDYPLIHIRHCMLERKDLHPESLAFEQPVGNC